MALGVAAACTPGTPSWREAWAGGSGPTASARRPSLGGRPLLTRSRGYHPRPNASDSPGPAAGVAQLGPTLRPRPDAGSHWTPGARARRLAVAPGPGRSGLPTRVPRRGATGRAGALCPPHGPSARSTLAEAPRPGWRHIHGPLHPLATPWAPSDTAHAARAALGVDGALFCSPGSPQDTPARSWPPAACPPLAGPSGPRRRVGLSASAAPRPARTRPVRRAAPPTEARAA